MRPVYTRVEGKAHACVCVCVEGGELHYVTEWMVASAGGCSVEVGARGICWEMDELYSVEVWPLFLTRLSALGGNHSLSAATPQT